MSLLESQGPAMTAPIGDTDDGRRSPDPNEPSGQEEADCGQSTSAGELPLFDPHKDARAVVRLIQCRQCSLPLRQPMSLACGNSICRGCLPELHKRENITYPATSGRSEGFVCPFEDCGREHSMGDCSHDVTLARLIEQVSAEIARYRPLTTDTPTRLDEQVQWQKGMDSCKEPPRKGHSRILHGGRLVSTFTMAELGELRYDSEVSYQTMSSDGDDYAHLDCAMLEQLREVTRNELDCHVCFALMLDPLTLSCGHTFCRKCVARVLDHSQSCPACRRPLTIDAGALDSEKSNKRLSELLLALCHDQMANRVQQVEAEETELSRQEQIPLFVCTLAYPRIPTFLHIFEPRYRLMIRRAMETDRKFGMLAYNSRGDPQGDLGTTQFLLYGTLLEIVNMHLLPDGRSVIETVGVNRFCVREHSMRDGYIVGRVERVGDIPLAEEEALEAAQVTGNTVITSATDESPSDAAASQLTTLPTLELMNICTEFIHRMRSASAHWLSDHIIQAYGQMPEDPAIFPYWFASVLPINEAEKYRLLPTRSVRARLMICAEWVRRVERTRWYSRLQELMQPGSPLDPVSSSEDVPNANLPDADAPGDNISSDQTPNTNSSGVEVGDTTEANHRDNSPPVPISVIENTEGTARSECPAESETEPPLPAPSCPAEQTSVEVRQTPETVVMEEVATAAVVSSSSPPPPQQQQNSELSSST